MKKSAGLLLFRGRGPSLQVLLVHPGGPYWAKKDRGAWSIPKGEIEEGEDPLEAARRECAEETGLRPEGPFLPLKTVTQKGGKTVESWAVENEAEPPSTTGSLFAMEWPPGSGKLREFPEVDQAAFFSLRDAREKMNPAQAGLLLELENLVRRGA